MKIIAVINRKGGVGKTTTTINVGAALATMGHRVLLADLDEQGNMTEALGGTMEQAAVPYDMGAFLLAPDSRKRPTWVFTELGPNVWLLPSYKHLGDDLAELQRKKEWESRLRDKLALVAHRFDFVLIDCPPSFADGTAFLAFTAATHYIIPTDVEPSSVRGIRTLMEHTEAFIPAHNPGLKFAGFVFSRYNANQRGALKKHMASEILNTYGDDSALGCVRQDAAITESQNEGQSVLDYAPSSRGAADFKEIASALLKRL